jgi:catechol 2,3-dioxygenase-like lactoylglutathione lyase family enzyme
MPQGIAKKTCDVLPMLTAFHSVVVEAADFESGVDDYARLLGQSPGWFESKTGQDTRSALFALSNTLLELRCAEPGSVSRGPTTRGLAGIRLACDGGDELVERYTARGAPLIDQGIATARRCGDETGEADSRSWRSFGVDRAASRSIPVELVADEEGARPAWKDVALEDPKASIQALDHVVVFSAAIEATRDFYRDGLDIRLALDRSFEGRGVRLIFFRLAGVTIEIGGRIDAQTDAAAPDRFGGLAWQVADIDAIQARLRADRFDVSEIRDGNKPGTRVCTVRDPVHDVPTLLIEPVARPDPR